VLVLDEVLTMLSDRLAVAASAEVTYSRNDLFYLALHQQVALVRAPAGTRLCTPVFAQCYDLNKAVYRVIEVQKLMHRSRTWCLRRLFWDLSQAVCVV
jgi:hypothetical protein